MLNVMFPVLSNLLAYFISLKVPVLDLKLNNCVCVWEGVCARAPLCHSNDLEDMDSLL